VSSTPAPRGPSGAAPLPPEWLATTTLPLHLFPSGTVLHRVHRSVHDPVFFGPPRGSSPTFRFDNLGGTFGVLYVGFGRAGALVETLLRNPARRMVDYADIAARALTLIHSERDLKLVKLHGTGLQQLGCDNAISTGPYGPCGAWADALWAHQSKPDGIAYQSRHDPGEICVALFGRPDLRLVTDETTDLPDMLPMLANILSSYGKSISLTPPLLS
jgi:hypothetical protein